jgi:hypothetical protein
MFEKGQKIFFCFLGDVAEYVASGSQWESNNDVIKYGFKKTKCFAILRMPQSNQKTSSTDLKEHGDWCLA